MKNIEVNNVNYELIKDYKNGFELDEFVEKCTDYFKDYDYIVGDIAYGKLRLKGFYESTNKKVRNLNNYDKLNEYLEKNCAVDCKYFIVKKTKNEL